MSDKKKLFYMSEDTIIPLDGIKIIYLDEDRSGYHTRHCIRFSYLGGVEGDCYDWFDSGESALKKFKELKEYILGGGLND